MPDIILVIFVLTYIGMAIGRIPGLRTDRAGLAAIAAILMIVVNGADLRRAVAWVDFPTLALLRAHGAVRPLRHQRLLRLLRLSHHPCARLAAAAVGGDNRGLRCALGRAGQRYHCLCRAAAALP